MDIKEWLPEFKVSAESDEQLKEYFLKTSVLSEIINNEKWLVLGRKGTGKSAIYEFIAKSQPSEINSYYSIPLNFSSYPWPIHALYKDSLEGELNAYQKSWHYLIVVKSLSKLIQLRGKELNSDLKTCKKYFETIFGNPDPSLIEIVKSKLHRIEKLSLPNLEAGNLSISTGEISFEEITENEALKSKLRSNAFALTSYFEKILNNNIGQNKLILIFDQLDENWLSSEIEVYSKILSNLINASRAINSNSSLNKNIKTIVFMRSDIYDTLKFNDKTKIFEDSATEITWDENTLNEMYWQRILAFKPDSLFLDDSKKTNSIFEIKNVRHGATPFKHIMRRSFLRPRDLITYMNKIRKIHVTNKTGLYSSKDIYSAENSYSQTLYGELIDEWSNQLPEITKYLNVLQNIGIQSFTFKDFEKNSHQEFNSPSKSQLQDILTFLFKNSIIGQKQNANWEYVCTNPYIQINFEKPFHVNSGLKQRLVLTEKRSDRK